jgi:hypothetical protein
MEQLRAMNLQEVSMCCTKIRLNQTAVATTNLNAVLSEHIVLNAGASFKSYNHNFQQLVDLLGSYF